MGDKSPNHAMTKKAGKSIKEKRADKRGKAEAANHAVVIVPPKKG
ncbi:MAG TPA: hypothetical protein VIJ54_08860 [Actinomycetes bacterium]